MFGLPVYPRRAFNVVFIDGFHERAAVDRDIGLVVPVMKADGVIAFHDYGVEGLGVTGTVDEFAKWGGLKVELVRTLVIVRPVP